MSSTNEDRTEARRQAYLRAAQAAMAKRHRRQADELIPDEAGNQWVLEHFLESIKADKSQNKNIAKALKNAEKTFRKGWEDALKELKRETKGKPAWILTPEGVQLTVRGRHD